MKRFLLFTLLTFAAMQGGRAQTNLSGHSFYNANILAGEFRNGEKQMAEAKAKAIAEKEKEKGRKLTAEEQKELDDKLQEAQAKLKALEGGTKIAITIDFKNDTELVYKVDMKITDEALKAVGVSWLKRKAMRAAMAAIPSSVKCPYTIKDDLVIFGEDKDLDTLYLSRDGKHLTGIYEGSRKKMNPTKFTLTRTK